MIEVYQVLQLPVYHKPNLMRGKDACNVTRDARSCCNSCCQLSGRPEESSTWAGRPFITVLLQEILQHKAQLNLKLQSNLVRDPPQSLSTAITASLPVKAHRSRFDRNIHQIFLCSVQDLIMGVQENGQLYTLTYMNLYITSRQAKDLDLFQDIAKDIWLALSCQSSRVMHGGHTAMCESSYDPYRMQNSNIKIKL